LNTWLHDPLRFPACTIVGEVAQAHDGSLGMAHAFIDAIARAGADAVKFQTHIATAESTPAEPWRKRFSPQDATRFDYWRRMEFSEEQWHGLKRHADEKGLLFLSSPFSMEAVALLERVGVAGWKIASGEISNGPMLDRVAGSGLPVLLSTGMSALDEVDGAVQRVRRQSAPLAVLQCASIYPSPPEAVGLNVIPLLRARYGCAAGLSDHSGTIFPGLAAATTGIEVLEVHVALSRDMFGPDVVVSLTGEELATLVRGVRFIESMRASPVDKAQVLEGAEGLRAVFKKSIVARDDLAAGTRLAAEHLALKKPGTGLRAERLDSVLGRRLRRAVARDAQILPDDLDTEPEAAPPVAGAREAAR
jgi:N-acetylneuraminate synthase